MFPLVSHRVEHARRRRLKAARFCRGADNSVPDTIGIEVRLLRGGLRSPEAEVDPTVSLPLRLTAFDEHFYRTAASATAVVVGLACAVIGFAIDDSTIATLSLVLAPLGAIGLVDRYAERAELSPVVLPARQPDAVVLRYRPLRALAVMTAGAVFGGITVIAGSLQGLWEAVAYGIPLCVIFLLIAAMMVVSRVLVRLTISPHWIRVRLLGTDQEIAWDSIIEIGIAETPEGDVIIITCHETGVRHHRRIGWLAARRRLPGPVPEEQWTIPAAYWGTDPIMLLDALTCLHEDSAIRARLCPGLLTDLLIHGRELSGPADPEDTADRQR
ncbi:hypothetical protein AB0G00_00015 [Nocardia salmonicida]|uniref:hypothetical protein n=1 Tax=Nocardia salmonicida TaxID=53431 RepID=UPI0033D47834